MRKLNLFKVSYDECEEMTNQLDVLNITNQLQLDLKDSLIDNKNKEIYIWGRRLDNAESTITELHDLIGATDKQIRWLKVQRTGLGAIVLGLLGYLAVSLIK